MVIFFLITGFVFLVFGAKTLVKGASGLALSMKISPLVVGLTVVAFGTSAPEAFVNVQAVLAGKSDIGTGNIVGSCIYNILLILGVSALIKPIKTQLQVISFDAPVMIGSGIFLFIIALFLEKLTPSVGFLMIAALSVYTWKLIVKSRAESQEIQVEFQSPFSDSKKDLWKNVLYTLAGLGLLSIGSDWLIDSSVTIARALGVSEVMIGMTIITFGTTLPEFASNLIAVKEGQDDIAVGNIIGSNIFNILFVLGLSGLFSGEKGIPMDPMLIYFSLPVMLSTFILILPILINHSKITRLEGGYLVFSYLLYFCCLLLDARGIIVLKNFSLPGYLVLALITAAGIALSYLSLNFNNKNSTEQI